VKCADLFNIAGQGAIVTGGGQQITIDGGWTLGMAD